MRCGCSRDKCQWRRVPGGQTEAVEDDLGEEEDKENNEERHPVTVSIAPVLKNKRIMAPPAARRIEETADMEMSFATQKILEKRRTSKKKVAINIIKTNKMAADTGHQEPDETLSAVSILAPRPEASDNVFSSPAFTKFRTNHIKGSTAGQFN